MNESDVGMSTALTLQNEGTFVYVTPSGAVNDGPGTVVAALTVVPLKPRLITRFSQVPATAGSASMNSIVEKASAAVVLQPRIRFLSSSIAVSPWCARS